MSRWHLAVRNQQPPKSSLLTAFNDERMKDVAVKQNTNDNDNDNNKNNDDEKEKTQVPQNDVTKWIIRNLQN